MFLTCRKKERKKKEERNKEKKKKRRKEKKTEHNTCLSDLKSVVDSRLKGNLGHPQFCPDKDSEASVRILCWQTKQKKSGEISHSLGKKGEPYCGSQEWFLLSSALPASDRNYEKFPDIRRETWLVRWPLPSEEYIKRRATMDSSGGKDPGGLELILLHHQVLIFTLSVAQI